MLPVREYFKGQSRFQIVSDETIDRIQQQIDERWDGYLNESIGPEQHMSFNPDLALGTVARRIKP